MNKVIAIQEYLHVLAAGTPTATFTIGTQFRSYVLKNFIFQWWVQDETTKMWYYPPSNSQFNLNVGVSRVDGGLITDIPDSQTGVTVLAQGTQFVMTLTGQFSLNYYLTSPLLFSIFPINNGVNACGFYWTFIITVEHLD